MRLFTSILFLSLCSAAYSADKHYTLNIAEAEINISGKTATAMLINGSLPGPVLEFTEGDTAHITVNNALASDASIHWHGLLLPQDQDGVPYVTYMPIPAGGSFTYQFELSHAGTYWYHSHTNIDEQRGQYGAIVVLPKRPRDIHYDYDYVVQLSDWSDEDPAQILKNLKKDGDWYAAKKDSVVSLSGYAQRDALPAWLSNRWQRMEGMDVSDVGYDAFLANGKQQLHLFPNAKPGEVVRLRFINSAASSYFRIQQLNTPFTVIAADGLDVEPIDVKAFPMGMAETYDVLITIPDSGGAVIAANNIDGTGSAIIAVGSELNLAAPSLDTPDLYTAMDHSSHGEHGQMMDHSMHSEMNHSQHKMPMRTSEPVIHELLSYELLRPLKPVKYKGIPRVVKLDVTGDMESYTWSFNGKTMTMADAIKISRGEVVRFVFNNTTMMHHPLHLHGHFFKVISGNGDYDVLKHTVDVPPMGRVEIEFFADADKDWLFHCHNLYHAKTGMARIVRYDDYNGNPAFMAAKKASKDIKDDDFYHKAEWGLYTSGATITAEASNIHYRFSAEIERADWAETEVTLSAAKKLSVSKQVYVGLEQERDERIETLWRTGVQFRLPFLLDGDLWVNEEGDVDFMLVSEFRLNKNLMLDLEADTRQQWHAGLAWQVSPLFSWRLLGSDTMLAGVGFSYLW